MRILTGIDIIEINRIKKYIEINNKFINKVYTEKEIEYCESKGKQKYQHYAGRFAGKEAAFKALSELVENKYDLSWKNIQIINDEKNRPYIELLDINIEKIENIDISISHCKDYAISNVTVLIKGEKK